MPNSKIKLIVAVVFCVAISGFFFMLGFVVGERSMQSQIQGLQKQIETFIEQKEQGQSQHPREFLKEQFLENPEKIREDMKNLRENGIAGIIIEVTEGEEGLSFLLKGRRGEISEVFVTDATKITSAKEEGVLKDIVAEKRVLVIGKPLQKGEKIIEASIVNLLQEK